MPSGAVSHQWVEVRLRRPRAECTVGEDRAIREAGRFSPSAYRGANFGRSGPARGLLAHEDGEFREGGFSGTLVWDPAPKTELGWSFALSQSMGGASSGGMDALLERDTLEGLTANDDELGERRLEAKLGYGMPVLGSRLVGTPELGLGLTGTSREYTAGWRFALARRESVAFDLALEAVRREAANDDGAAEDRIGLALRLRYRRRSPKPASRPDERRRPVSVAVRRLCGR